MRYSLWSLGRLVGHTDLDIHTISESMRQGFVEPTEEGRSVLADATGVWRAMAERKRAQRARDGEESHEDDQAVLESMRRREEINLELRDEHDQVFECEFMRVYDIFDVHGGVVDEMGDTDEEREAEFEVYLSSLSPEEREQALAERAECEAEIEAFVSEMTAEREEEDMLGAGWPLPPPDDPRWQTMQYHLQVYLKRCLEHEAEF